MDPVPCWHLPLPDMGSPCGLMEEIDAPRHLVSGRSGNRRIMQPGSSSLLQMPSFLYGTFASIQRQAHAEGRRCGTHYQKSGVFPASHQLVEVPWGEVVVLQAGADFQRERAVWRLYCMWNVLEGLFEAVDWQNTSQVRDAYEAFCRETAWGALYFAIAQTAPMSAERVATRLHAVLRFWEPLQSLRYIFKTHNAVLTLEELMATACDWAMDAWCPAAEPSIRARLTSAADRMSRASKEDSLHAMLRQMPQALAHARGLKHREVLANPTAQRRFLATLDPESFERLSSACTSDLLAQLHAWERQLAKQ